MKFYKLKNDAIFKNVFYRHEDLLMWLLNRIMCQYEPYININNLVIKNCELTKNRKYIKNKTVDMLIKTNDRMYNIELNNCFDYKRKIRNFFYQTSLLNNTISKSGEYSEVLPLVQINLNFKQNRTKKLINKYMPLEIETYEKYLDIFYNINIDIERIIDEWYNLNKDKKYYEKYKHYLIIGMNKEELNNLEDDDEMIQKIKKEIITLNNDDEFYQVLTDEEDEEFIRRSYFKEGEQAGIERGRIYGKIEGKKEEKKEGKKDGIRFEKINNARKMKKENIPLNLIKKITGLDINTISNL